MYNLVFYLSLSPLLAILTFFTTTGTSREASPHIKPFETPIAKYIKPLEISEFDSGLDTIDCIYTINLDHRPDKWKRVKALFEERGLRANRMSAVNGWELSEDLINEICGPYNLRVGNGHYGCLLSHLSVLKDAYERDFNVIWICEDDVDFLKDVIVIPDYIRSLSVLDPEWDVFFTDIVPRIYENGRVIHYFHKQLCYQRPDQVAEPTSFFRERESFGKDFIKIHKRSGTTSMIISRKGIKKILDYFTHVYIWTPIDQDMHFIPDLHEYVPRGDIVSNWVEADSDTVRLIDKTAQDVDEETLFLTQNTSLKQALSLFTSLNHSQAHIAFDAFIRGGGPKPEIYWAMVQKGEVERNLRLPSVVYFGSFQKAFEFLPTRAEAIYELAMYHRNEGNFKEAYAFAKKGIDLPVPNDSQYFSSYVYQWGIHFEFCLAAYHTGNYIECIKAAKKVVSEPSTPMKERQTALEYLNLAKEKLVNIRNMIHSNAS